MALMPAPDPANPKRRIPLGGALAASAAALIPTAFAAAGDATASGAAFLSISKALCGDYFPVPHHAAPLCNALIAEDAQFAEGVQALAALMDRRKIDPLKMQLGFSMTNTPHSRRYPARLLERGISA